MPGNDPDPDRAHCTVARSRLAMSYCACLIVCAAGCSVLDELFPLDLKRAHHGRANMLTPLLIVIVVLTACTAAFTFLTVRQLAKLAATLLCMNASPSANGRQPTAQPSPPLAHGTSSDSAHGTGKDPPADETPQPGHASSPILLPNGRPRIDYIRDRYYRDHASRSTILAELNHMLAEAGIEENVQRQVVSTATRDPTDPRDYPSRRRGTRESDSD